MIIICILFAGSLCYAQPVRITRQDKPIKLPSPDTKGKVSLAQAINYRRNVLDFTDEPLRLEQIAQLAWAGQGITDKEKNLRAVPSAGAIYPMQLHIVLPDGLYLYNPESHSIIKTINGDIRRALYSTSFAQPVVSKALCSFVISGSPRKIETKYRNRGERFISLEAGHIAQNLQLQAVALGLGSATIGRIDPKGIAKACKLPSLTEPLYIICVGYPTTPVPITPISQGDSPEVAKEPKIQKAVFIIGSKRFKEKDLFDTEMILDIVGVETTIASSELGTIRGMAGQRVEATVLVRNIDVDDYDAIIFIGGVGAREYFNDRAAIRIAQQAVRKNKILGAICIAPGILARAGVVRGRRVASAYSERKALTLAGADWTMNDVERDGLLITANASTSAQRFGKAILAALRGKPPQRLQMRDNRRGTTGY